MTFEEYRQSLLNKLTNNWTIVGEKSIPYGYQYELMDGGGGRANLNCYHGKKGFKFVTGGRLAATLEEAITGKKALVFSDAMPEQTRPIGNPFNLSLPRIGADESGKGDFFGPLVVASFYLTKEHEPVLKKLGVDDSKKLTDHKIMRLAGEIDSLNSAETISLMPPRYNLEYNKLGNLNTLLSRMHGRCIARLVKRLGAPTDIIVDQFSTKTTELRNATNPPAGTKLHTRTKAEADLAVAAASVLARAGFLDGLKLMEDEWGTNFPTGAGSPVIQAGRAFKRSFGEPKLSQVAKVHFKTLASL